MQYMATALNALKRRGREVLVLHHVARLTPEDLARLLEQPTEEVLARIGRAERHLARWLGVPNCGLADRIRGGAWTPAGCRRWRLVRWTT